MYYIYMNYLNKINKSIIENNNEKKNKYINKLKIYGGGIVKLEGDWVEVLNSKGVFVGIMDWTGKYDKNKKFIGSWDGNWINNKNGKLINNNKISEYIGYWIYLDKEKKEQQVKIKWKGYFDGKIWNGYYKVLDKKKIIKNNKKITYEEINDIKEKIINKFYDFILEIEYDEIINSGYYNTVDDNENSKIFSKDDSKMEYYLNFYILYFNKYSSDIKDYSMQNTEFEKYINAKPIKYFYNNSYTLNTLLYPNKITISSLEEKKSLSLIINNDDFLYITYISDVKSYNYNYYNVYIINSDSIKNKKLKKIKLNFDGVKKLILIYNIYNNFSYNFYIYSLIFSLKVYFNYAIQTISDILDNLKKYSKEFIIKNIMNILPYPILYKDDNKEYIKNIYCITYEINNKDIKDTDERIITILESELGISTLSKNIDYYNILEKIIDDDNIFLDDEIINDSDIIQIKNDKYEEEKKKYIIISFFINYFLLSKKLNNFIYYIKNEIIKEYKEIIKKEYDIPILNNGGFFNNLKNIKKKIINEIYPENDNKKFYNINLKFNYTIDYILKNHYYNDFYLEYKKYLNNYNNLIILKNNDINNKIYYNFNDLNEYLKIKDTDIDENILLNYCKIFEDDIYFNIYEERDTLLFLYGLIFVRLFNKYYKNMINNKKKLSDDFLYNILYFLNSCLNDDKTFQHEDKTFTKFLIKSIFSQKNCYLKNNSAIVNSIKMKLLHLYLLEISLRSDLNNGTNNDNIFVNIKMRLLNNKILLYDINYKEIFRLVEKNYKKIDEYDYFIISMIGIANGIYLKTEKNTINKEQYSLNKIISNLIENHDRFACHMLFFILYEFDNPVYDELWGNEFVGKTIDEKVILMEEKYYGNDYGNDELDFIIELKLEWKKLFYNEKILPNNKTSIKFGNIITMINMVNNNGLDINYINNIDEIFCVYDDIRQHGTYYSSMNLSAIKNPVEQDLNLLYSELIAYRFIYFKDYKEKNNDNFIFKNLSDIFKLLNVDNYLKNITNFSEKFNSIFIIYIYMFHTEKNKISDNLLEKSLSYIINFTGNDNIYKKPLLYNIIDKIDNISIINKFINKYYLNLAIPGNNLYDDDVEYKIYGDIKNFSIDDANAGKFTNTIYLKDKKYFYKKVSKYLEINISKSFFWGETIKRNFENNEFELSSIEISFPVEINILLIKLYNSNIYYNIWKNKNNNSYLIELMKFEDIYFYYYNNILYYYNNINDKYKVIIDINNLTKSMWIQNMTNGFIIEDNEGYGINYILFFMNNKFISYFFDISKEKKLKNINNIYLLRLNFNNLLIVNDNYNDICALIISLYITNNKICMRLLIDVLINLDKRYGELDNNIYIYSNLLKENKIIENIKKTNSHNKITNKIILETNKDLLDFNLNQLTKMPEYLILQSIINKINYNNENTTFTETEIIDFLSKFRYDCSSTSLIKYTPINKKSFINNDNYGYIDMLLKNNYINLMEIYIKYYINIYSLLIKKIFNEIKINFNIIIRSTYNCKMILKCMESINTSVIYNLDKKRNLEHIIFEFTDGVIIRDLQIGYIDNIDKDKGKSVFQILMGVGKTSTITPILILREYINNIQTNKNSNINIVLPKHLINDSFNIINKYGSMILNIPIYFNKYVLTTESLEFINITSDYEMKKNIIKNIIENIIDNKEILNKNTNSLFIFDEFDSLINPLKSEFNRPIDSKYHIFNDFITNYCFEYYFNKNKDYDDISPPDPEIQMKLKDKIKKIDLYLKNNLKNQKYGFAYSDEDYNTDTAENIKKIKNFKKFFIAVPYNANFSPSNNSSFSDFELSLVLTIILFSEQGFREKDILLIFLTMRKYNKLLLNIEFPEEFCNFYYILESMFKNNLFKEFIKKCIEISEKITKSDKYKELMTFYLKNIIFFKYFKIYKNKYSTNTIDMLNNRIVPRKIAFSGTIEFYDTALLIQDMFDKTTPINSSKYYNEIKNACDSQFYQKKEDNYSIGSVKYAIKNIAMKITYEPLNEKKEDELLKTVYKLINEHSLNSLIDTAGIFLINNTLSVIKKIYDNINDKNKKILYVDENDTKRIYEPNNIGIHKKYSNEVFQNVFIYYDNKHCIGTDFKQPFKMSGLVTISLKNNITEISQGMYRLRNINIGHTIIFYIPEKYKDDDIYKALSAQEEKYKKSTLKACNIQCINFLYKYIKNKNENYKYEIFYDLEKNNGTFINSDDFFDRYRLELEKLTGLKINDKIIKTGILYDNPSDAQQEEEEEEEEEGEGEAQEEEAPKDTSKIIINSFNYILQNEHSTNYIYNTNKKIKPFDVIIKLFVKNTNNMLLNNLITLSENICLSIDYRIYIMKYYELKTTNVKINLFYLIKKNNIIIIDGIDYLNIKNKPDNDIKIILDRNGFVLYNNNPDNNEILAKNLIKLFLCDNLKLGLIEQYKILHHFIIYYINNDNNEQYGIVFLLNFLMYMFIISNNFSLYLNMEKNKNKYFVKQPFFNYDYTDKKSWLSIFEINSSNSVKIMDYVNSNYNNINLTGGNKKYKITKI